MAKNDEAPGVRDSVVSIIGPGMRVKGDCETEGTLRVEGMVEGMVKAGKAVVVGKDGEVRGDILTQDAIIGGKVVGTVVAESRLELQATCVIEGEIRARRVKLDEGGVVNGDIRVGESAARGDAGGTGRGGRGNAPAAASATTRPAGSEQGSPKVGT